MQNWLVEKERQPTFSSTDSVSESCPSQISSSDRGLLRTKTCNDSPKLTIGLFLTACTWKYEETTITPGSAEESFSLHNLWQCTHLLTCRQSGMHLALDLVALIMKYYHQSSMGHSGMLHCLCQVLRSFHKTLNVGLSVLRGCGSVSLRRSHI